MQTLFDLPPDKPLPHNNTSTSRAAAETKQATGTASTDRNRIAAFLHSEPRGATRAQLAAVLFINPDSVRPRCCELIEQGFIVESGEVREWNGHQESKVLVHRIHAGGSQ